MHYKETDYPGINADGRSLTVAFANLLQKMDSDYQPTPDELYDLLASDGPTIDWWSVAEYVDDMEIKEIRATADEWPPDHNAIIKFRRIDQIAAGPVDHYVVVADHNAHSIIDSLDGVIKSIAAYGEIQAWATYVKIKPDPELDAEEARILAEAGNNPNIYILKKGENLWDAARATHFKIEELMKLNNIEDPRVPRHGFKLHLPIREPKEQKVVEYEILDEPVPMHVNKNGGAKKYTFGNATKWDDIETTGRTHGENTNHMIYAIAHVHLKKEDVTAAYYMDRIDLGNYAVTGRPQFMTGFSHSHMSEGHVLPDQLTAPKEELIEAINQAAPILEAAQEAANVQPKQLDITIETEQPEPPETASDDDYRSTLVAINEDESPVTFIAEETIAIHEIKRRRPSRPLMKGQHIKITHTFEYGDTLYGLPYGTKDNPFWYGIPMDQVISEEELYNFNVPLNERIAMRGRLSVQEHGVVILSKVLSQGTRLRVWLKNKKGA